MTNPKSVQDYAVRIANVRDEAAVLALLNQAYREPPDRHQNHHQTTNHWTTEAHLVTGARLNASQYAQLLANDAMQMLLLYRVDNLSVVGCICLTFNPTEVEIGGFAICPSLQNLGLGQYLLHYAEQFARAHQPYFECFSLYVLHVRQELIDFYVRRGYALLPVFLDYPVGDDVGVPKVPLKLQRMQKSVLG